MSIRKIGILAKRHKPEAAEVIEKLIPWLEERGVETIVDKEFAPLLGIKSRPLEKEALPANVDLIAVFGGDGTLLSVARLMGNSHPLVLGVNLGSLGFLTEVTLDELYAAFEALLKGDFEVDNRMMIDTVLKREGERIAAYRALNDAVINKGALARIIDMEIYIDGQFVSDFRAYGLIISTPTGSTAYSLSAGGPIVYPSMEAFVITAICPQTLTNRPLVVSSSSHIEVVLSSGTDVMLTVDGQVGLPMLVGDATIVTRAENPFRLVKPRGKNYFEVLRRKLNWGGTIKIGKTE